MRDRTMIAIPGEDKPVTLQQYKMRVRRWRRSMLAHFKQVGRVDLMRGFNMDTALADYAINNWIHIYDSKAKPKQADAHPLEIFHACIKTGIKPILESELKEITF